MKESAEKLKRIYNSTRYREAVEKGEPLTNVHLFGEEQISELVKAYETRVGSKRRGWNDGLNKVINGKATMKSYITSKELKKFVADFFNTTWDELVTVEGHFWQGVAREIHKARCLEGVKARAQGIRTHRKQNIFKLDYEVAQIKKIISVMHRNGASLSVSNNAFKIKYKGETISMIYSNYGTWENYNERVKPEFVDAELENYNRNQEVPRFLKAYGAAAHKATTGRALKEAIGRLIWQGLNYEAAIGQIIGEAKAYRKQMGDSEEKLHPTVWLSSDCFLKVKEV